MGQAKRRGTFEDRKAAAVARLLPVPGTGYPALGAMPCAQVGPRVLVVDDRPRVSLRVAALAAALCSINRK